MGFEVEYTDTFEAWWLTLDESEQISVAAAVMVLEQRGPALGRPQVDTLVGTRYPNLKKLRVQHSGAPIRVLFAFDPRRVALLLVGGNKQGDTNWYTRNIAIAERLYTQHLQQLEKVNELSSERFHAMRSVEATAISKEPKKFAALVEGMSPAAHKKARERAAATLQQMALHELRKARRRTQREVAQDMHVAQSEISKIEQRSDLRLGTLNNYVQALGGTLEVRAVFPESSIELVVAQTK